MMLPPVDLRRAEAIAARFRDVRVLVVGDLMLDRFIVGRVTRISPEAPVPVVQYRTEHVRLGGAANVANNVAALGGRAVLVGFVGRDEAAERLRAALAGAGIDAGGLVEASGRPTTEKVRIVTERNQQVARIDYELDQDADGTAAVALVNTLAHAVAGADVVVVSDYLKGAVTRAVVETALARRAGGVPLLVDPKIPHLSCYAGATVITPNHYEAEAATHRRIRTDEDAREAARDFRAIAACESVLVTRGEQGMWLSHPAVEGSIPAVAREVSDVTGAGDTVVATLALALAAGATLEEGANLANHAAGVVVGKFGPATVTRDELLAALSAPRTPEPAQDL
jgi:rfaE bifunctional protein kinase chain/domain